MNKKVLYDFYGWQLTAKSGHTGGIKNPAQLRGGSRNIERPGTSGMDRIIGVLTREQIEAS